jgi:quaternary ammonium compound-resistance protein SugE
MCEDRAAINSAARERFVVEERSMSQTASWLVLIVAGLFEVGWAIGLKYTAGFTRLWPSVWTAIALLLSMALLGAAVKALPVGTAYAVWVGIGAVGTAVLGVVLLGEAASVGRVASIVLIVAGIVGLKLATPA